MDNVRLIIAEYSNPARLLKAAEGLRDSGYRKFDCHSPFPIHGMDSAMGMGRSKLGFIVGTFALIGLIVGFAIQWWSAVIAYPLVISGKPLFSYQAYLPVPFALAVLFSAISALFGMMALNKLPRLNHPVFESGLFKKVSSSGFMVTVEASDPNFDEAKTAELLKSLGAVNLEIIE